MKAKSKRININIRGPRNEENIKCFDSFKYYSKNKEMTFMELFVEQSKFYLNKEEFIYLKEDKVPYLEKKIKHLESKINHIKNIVN